ncbi:MAG: VWA domain-containing protein [Planctomycetaceae bacterium]|nr:VWA domain-containing protein [Planctomycetaceae bacterium]
MFRIGFEPIFGSYVIVLLCAAVLCAVIWWSRPRGERLPLYGQRILLSLRILALLLLLFGMLRPALIHTVSYRLSSVVNIMLDQTQSMTRNDEIAGKSRFTVAKESLQQATPQLRRLQRQADVRAFTFDSALNPLNLQDGLFTDLPDTPKGTETAIGLTLDTIRERSAGKRVLATIMLSDGAQRTRPIRDILPQDAAARLRDAGIPLYTIALGQAGFDANSRDISIESVHANDRVFVKNTFLVSGTLRITGFADQMIPVQLLMETGRGRQEIVAATTVQAGGDGHEVRFQLSYAPQTVGLFKYTVKVPPQEREVTDRNNEQSGFVRVLEGGLRVLFIQGQLNNEQGPLRRALNASPDINVNYLRVLRPGDLGAVFRDDPVPYNVFMLSDIDSSKFSREELQVLVNKVRTGDGLIMLGGLHAFGAGGYADTPLAQISPIEFRRADQQPLDGPIRTDIHFPESHPIQMRPTDQEQRHHYIMQFDADPRVNMQRWAALPPLEGANKFDRTRLGDSLRPGARILAVGPRGESLLVMQPMAGIGRVLAFAGDTTWRWRLYGFEEEHNTFWRQVVLWLAKMEEGGSGTCWVTVENNRLMPNDTAKFQIFMRSETGEEIRDFSATARVLKPDANMETVTLVSENGVPTGSFRSTDYSGDYTIQVEAVHNGEVKHAEARFLVQDRNLELDDPRAYPSLLSAIATETGGRSVPPEQLGALIEELLKQSDELVEKRETKSTLFDNWLLLLAFISVLSLEWFLRKHWGLA